LYPHFRQSPGDLGGYTGKVPFSGGWGGLNI